MIVAAISFSFDYNCVKIPFQSPDTPVILYSIEFPPWLYYDKDGKVTGITPDLLDAMHIPGIDIGSHHVHIIPRADIITKVKSESNVFTGPVSKTGKNEEQFLWSDIVFNDTDVAFSLTNHEIEIRALPDLNAYTIGVLNGSSSPYRLVSLGYDYDDLFLGEDLYSLFEALYNEEIDLIVISELGGLYEIFQNYGHLTEFSISYRFDDMAERHFMFNANTSPDIITQINAELARLKVPDESGLSEYDLITASHLTSREFYPVTYVATHDYPTITIAENNSSVSGIAVDLVDAICARIGILDTKATGIIFIPQLAYAVDYVQKTPGAVLLGLSKTRENEELFKWVGPIIEARTGVLGKIEQETIIATPADLMKYRLGVIKGSTSEISILNTGFPIHQLVYADDANHLLSLFEQGEVDLIVAREMILANLLLGSEEVEYTLVRFLDTIPQYFAFNIDTPDIVIHEFQNELHNLKAQPKEKEGTLSVYDEIVMRYFPQDILRSSYYVIGISSYDESDPWTQSVQNGIRDVFKQDPRIIYHTDSLKMEVIPLDPTEAKEYTSNMYDVYAEKYKNVLVDVFLTIGPEASFSVPSLERGHLISSPHFHTYATTNLVKGELPEPGIILEAAFEETIALAKTLHPHASVGYFILPFNRGELSIEPLFEHFLETYEDNFDTPFTYRLSPPNLSHEDLIADIYRSGEPTIIFLWDYTFTDTLGHRYPISAIIDDFSSKLSDPIYAVGDQFNGHGVVGGYQLSGSRVGNLLGTTTTRLLYGEDPSQIHSVIYHPDHPTLDAQVLSRFGVDPSLIPADAEIINEELSVLEIPRTLVFVAIACFIVLILTILRFSYNKRRLSLTREEAISQRQFLENIINHMPIGIVIVDILEDDLCIYLNEKYTLYSGLSSERIYRKHLSENKSFQKIKSDVLQKKHAISVEGVNLWPKTLAGRYLRFTATPIYNIDGECAFLIGDVIDLTNVYEKKREAEESLSRLVEFVEQNAATIGFYLPMYEDGVFTGVIVKETNIAYKNMLSSLHSDVVDFHITHNTPGCEWLMKAFSQLHLDPKTPYAFENIYVHSLDRYISGHTFWCSEDPAYICLYITDKTEEITLRSAEMEAFKELAKNIFALATLNDKIRNPLSIVMSFIEMDYLACEAQLISLVKSVDSFIDALDMGFAESEVLYRAIERQNSEEKG